LSSVVGIPLMKKICESPSCVKLHWESFLLVWCQNVVNLLKMVIA
jgi:hypothetical protein